MTQAVQTEGFVQPSNVVTGGTNVPPSNPQPGFVPQPNTPSQTPEPTQAPTAITPDLASTLAALTAALVPTQKTPEVAEVPSNPGSLNNFDVESLDDPIIKSMATVMQSIGVGLDMDRALGKAIELGRADLIDVAYLREKGGANSAQLITIAQGLVQAVEAKSAQVTAKVHDLAGGSAQWDSSIAAFNTGAPQEVRVVIAQMLDSGKQNLIEAAAKVIVDFGKGSGMIPRTSQQVQAGAGSNAAQAMTKSQFQVELFKLNPNDRSFNEQRAALFARRQTGKQLGL